MEAQPEHPAEEIKRLRRCIDDLVSVTALPAAWSGGEPAEVVRTLIDVLPGTLGLDLVYARLEVGVGEPPVEMARVAQSLSPAAGPREIGKLLDRWMGGDPRNWPPVSHNTVGGAEMTVAPLPLGLRGEFGVLVAGSRRADFPQQTERLVLGVAANQAATGLQQALLLGEQRRVAGGLDERVAQRTSELAAANEALQKEVAERERAEAALRESERESRLILDNIPGLVALLTAAGEVEVVNRQLLEYFGQTLGELRRWGTNGTVHPEDLPQVAEVFTRSIESGSPYNIVQRFRRSDGAYRWFENSGFPLRDAGGKVARWCVLLTDIDERKRAEEALASSERNLKLIIDTIPALAWSTGPDGGADFFNQHYLDFIGLSAEQVAGWGWTVALHPDDRDGLAATWQRIMAAGESGEAEARLRRFDGEYRWFLFRANPLRDESGNIVKWYGTNTDIDDRKRAEAQRDRTIEALRAKQELLDLAQKSARAMAFDWHLRRDVNVWSPEQESLYGLPPGGFDGTYRSWRKLVYPPDWPLLAEAVERARQTGEVNVEFRVVWPDGSLHWLATSGRMFFDGRGDPSRVVGFTSDVTPRKLAEEDLRSLRSELAHVSRVATLGALTASIAHEVNQPLSGIITNASTCLRMLAADPPNLDGARETARRTIRDGRRAADVITRLRALFGRRGAAAEPVDLNEAAREVVALSSGEFQRGRVVLRAEFADGLPPVTGDRIQLQQVILNLLRNGADAMGGVEGRPRELVIRTRRDGGGRVRLDVQDAGVGFDPQAADRLFEAFYTTKDDGMGIGLSVSRTIIESHQGRLWAAPNDGPGATFSFSIPEASGEEAAAAGLGEVPTPTPTDAGRAGGGS